MCLVNFLFTDGKQVTVTDTIRSIQWSTWTCVLGSEVNGIWPKYTQINDVNAIDANFALDVCATGDDFGLVKLFQFPSLKKGKLNVYIVNYWAKYCLIQ